MGKISPVSVKYMIHANFSAEGTLEKPDVIGAIFGQTEGLLGSDLEMRELQKEGKIGRIEVELKKDGKRTIGTIEIPTTLDQSETTLIAAAIETIERIGPSDSQIEVEKIEDVRGSKRDFIVERAKQLMKGFNENVSSREISDEIKSSSKANLTEYGDEKLPCGDISGNEIIVVEGRADVINLMRNGVKNVIGMNGTKLPEAIRELGKEKEITLFVDGDRGGNLIVKNVVANAEVKYVITAPSGKEVEELTNKEILMTLRKRLTPKEFFSVEGKLSKAPSYGVLPQKHEDKDSRENVNSEITEKLKEISKRNQGSEKAVILDESLNEIKNVSVKTLASSLSRLKEKPNFIIVDGIVTSSIIKAAEEAGCRAIVGKNFATTDTKLQLMSF